MWCFDVATAVSAFQGEGVVFHGGEAAVCLQHLGFTVDHLDWGLVASKAHPVSAAVTVFSVISVLAAFPSTPASMPSCLVAQH